MVIGIPGSEGISSLREAAPSALDGPAEVCAAEARLSVLLAATLDTAFDGFSDRGDPHPAAINSAQTAAISHCAPQPCRLITLSPYTRVHNYWILINSCKPNVGNGYRQMSILPSRDTIAYINLRM